MLRLLSATLLCFVFLSTDITRVHASKDVETMSLAILELTTLSSTKSESIFVTPAEFGPELPVAALLTSYLPLVIADPIEACSPLSMNVSGNAVMVNRGLCDFEEKVLNCQKAGAQLVIIKDSVISDSQLDCNLGHGIFCEQYPTCSSQSCALDASTSRKCCVRNSLLVMKPTLSATQKSTKITIASVFATIRDGNAINQLAQSKSMIVTAYKPKDENPWNVSMGLIWMLGVIVAIFASYQSAAKERYFSRQVVASTYVLGDSTQSSAYAPIREHGNDIDDAPVQLTSSHALMFLVMGSGMLILMFYVHVLIIVNIVFAVASFLCVTIIITYPLVVYFVPTVESHVIKTPFGLFSYGLIGSAIPSLTLVIVWFIYRTNSCSWILQDIFAACLCFVFIDSIHIQSLRVATILLCVAFVYDVFFVYISPYVFGSNVMVEVASGGGNIKLHLNEFCVRHPESFQCAHETMPLVFSIPLIFSYYGGYSLLGLGDIVIPSLVLSFCIRYDYCMGYSIAKNYFMVASISYVVALLLANIMAIVLRDFVAGQPALMYIVPIELGAIFICAWFKSEFHELWHGPECLDMSIEGKSN